MSLTSAQRLRHLIHIPIVHSEVDMGSSSDDVRQAYIDRKGLAAWRESRQAITRFWTTVEDKIAALDLDFGRVRLYQDGLPVCGHEIDIVRDLANGGGPNYRILKALIERGAALEGTEDAKLLLMEYQILKAGIPAGSAEANAGPEQGAPALALDRLLEERDRYIAKRIDATLRRSEIGILFLGALHRVREMIPKDIHVWSLDAFIARADGTAD